MTQRKVTKTQNDFNGTKQSIREGFHAVGDSSLISRTTGYYSTEDLNSCQTTRMELLKPLLY
jgi:hypothetical protein